MLTNIRAAKAVIDDMFVKLGGEPYECPESEAQAEYLLLYTTCRRFKGSARKVMLRWDRYAFLPQAFQKDVEPHALGDWQYFSPKAEWRRTFSFYDPGELNWDPADMLHLHVSVREKHVNGDALVVAWLFDSVDEEERYDETDREKAYRLRLLPTSEALAAHYESQGIFPAAFDVTDQELAWLDTFIGYYAQFSSGGPESLLRLAYIGGVLLTIYLGEVWKDRHVWRGLFGEVKGKTLGQFGSITHLAAEKHFFRVVSLADIFYNFHTVPGIQERARLCSTENIESVLGELEGAQLLYASGREIAFVNPPGGSGVEAEKGENYDLDVTLSDGTRIACELKTKIEATKFGPDTVRETMRKAAAQLPSDRPGVVILKVPDVWFDQVDAEVMLEEVATDFFRQRRSISAVFYHWHLWTRVGTQTRQNFNYRVYVNPNARHTHPEVAELIRPPLRRYRRLSEILDIPHMIFRHAVDDGVR